MKCICIMNILNDINTLLRPSKNITNTIELTVHTSCYWGLRLLCVKRYSWRFRNLLKIQTRILNSQI